MKPLFRQLVCAIITLVILVGFIATPLTPLLSIVESQSTQTTDTFTGQFIPAYLGAAYDPSEAYKQLAGAVVYVFAYDTWGKVVNDFAYKTQVRADGSFQAAGLPNASHYAVLFPDPDLAPSPNKQIPFRAPKDEDGLAPIFAYQQTDYSKIPNCSPAQIQIGEQKLNGEDGNPNMCGPVSPTGDGPKFFVTSSRSVDIANHVNIFPLVPTSVLSVIIKDRYLDNGSDFYNVNTPYEIYAQRVGVNSKTSPQCSDNGFGLGGAVGCTTDDINQTVNGPIIRGRSIAMRKDDGSPAGATIFQAFAPLGVYAITYWKPDSRDIENAITYLNFNGTAPLNTPYNGIAFENVVIPGKDVVIKEGDDGKDTNQWLLATRDPSKFSWSPKPGNLNIWGVTTVSSRGVPIPIGGARISISNNWFGFADPMTRTCAGSTNGTVSSWGIYLFSTACNQSSSEAISSTTAEISVRAGSSANIGSSTIYYRGIDGKSITANGTDGPSRNSFSLSSIPENGLGATLYQNGRPVVNRNFSMKIGSRVINNVATTDSAGYLIIPGAYFANRYTSYEIFSGISSSFMRPASRNYLSFTVDDRSLTNPALALNNLGRVDLDTKQGAVSRWLAKLNLNTLVDNFHIQPVMAYGENPEDLTPAEVNLLLDMGTITGINPNPWFTLTDYDLTTVEIVYPDEVRDVLNDNNQTLKENYVAFNRYRPLGGANYVENYKQGLITSSDKIPAGPDQSAYQSVIENDGGNPVILGVKLTLKELEDGEMKHKLDDTFRTYVTANNGTDDNTTIPVDSSMPLLLRVTFEKTNQTGTGGDQGQTGQDNSQALPSKLTSEWPLTLVYAGAADQGDKVAHYKIVYDPIVLAIQPAGCPKSNGWFGTGIGDSFNPTHLLCSFVSGMVGVVGKAMDYIATHFVTVDPLRYGIARDGWNVMRNFVNGLAVLILVIAGIAIMLRYEPQWFSLQQVLTRLVITILLVNFSILIIQFGIDLANVFATGGYFFLTSLLTSAGGTTGSGAAAGLVALVAGMIGLAVAVPGPGLFAFLVGALVFILALLYVLFKAGMYWILRQIMLVICIVAAPLALAARLLPGTQQYYNKWKTITMSTLINQILFAFILALGMGMLNYAVTSNHGASGFMSALVELGIAIGLFWYTTKFPQKAAPELNAAVENLTKQGLTRARSGLGAIRKARERRSTVKAIRDAGIKDYGKWWTRANVKGSLKQFATGVSGEDLIKQREHLFAEAQQEFRAEQEAHLISKGLLGAEAKAKLNEVSEQLEYRMLAAKGGVSKGAFEQNRDLVDTGGNADYSNNGKTIISTNNAEWLAKFTDEKGGTFYNQLGGDDPDGVAARLLTVMRSRPDQAIKNEDDLISVLADMYDGGDKNLPELTKKLKEEGVTFGELQGPHGMKGFMLSGLASAAAKIDPTYNSSLKAQRNKLNRGITPGTDVTVPALPVTPYSPTAATWATNAGFPPLRVPATGLKPGIPTADIQDWLDDLEIVHMEVDAGRVPTPPMMAQYTNAYRRLRAAGYEL